MQPTLLYLTLAAASAGLCVALTPIVVRLAGAFGLVDLPDVRKVHRTPVPRVGGLAIALATLLPIACVLWFFRDAAFSDTADYVRTITLLAAAACVVIVGLIDDILNISAKFKLVVLLGAAAAFCASGGAIQALTINGKSVLELGALSWPVTMLWIVGVTVSINFIDGLDGLAAGITAIAAAVLALGAHVGGGSAAIVVSLCLVAALAGFLVFNFHPARIFMGDCGSMFIGFMLAGSCALASSKIGTTRAIALPALALGIPVLDTFLTLVRRGILQRRSLFAAERGHIHHRLLDIGLHHRHVVLVLWGVTLAGAVVAIVGLYGSAWGEAIAAFAFGLILYFLFRIAGSVRARATVEAIRRNREIGRETRRYQQAFHDLEIGFRDAKTVEAWWRQLCKAGERLDFARMQMTMVRRNGEKVPYSWNRNVSDLGGLADSISADVPVPQRRAGQTLRVSVEVASSKYLESAGQRLALFSRLIGEFGLSQLPMPKARQESFIDAIAPTQPTPQEEKDAETAAIAGPLASLRIAVVHDFLYTYAGAERVLEQLVEMFPRADIFSLFDFLPSDQRGFIRRKPVTSTFIQKMPMARKKHRAYLPLMPLAIEQLDVSNYDLVISSSYLVAKGVITRPDQLHICYCHTPVRFAWDMQKQYLSTSGLTGGIKAFVARCILHYVRNWDVRSSNSVDRFVTNSDFVGHRIRKYYRRDATTIYPPVDTDLFSLHETKDEYYLTASRLVQYKRIDLIVEAFNQTPDRKLIVIGDGPDFEKIKTMAGPNVSVLGFQSAERLQYYMQRAKAFVFAAEEDFGIVPVEAQACGTPVIAFGRGGVTESVIPGETGVLFDEQTPESINDAVKRFEAQDWDARLIRENALRFSIPAFRESLFGLIRSEWTRFSAERCGKAAGEFRSEVVQADRPGAVVQVKPSTEPKEKVPTAAATKVGALPPTGAGHPATPVVRAT